MTGFDWSVLSVDNLAVASALLGELRPADLDIEFGGVCLHRWSLVPGNKFVKIHLQIQVSSEGRALHVQPQDHTVVILSGERATQTTYSWNEWAGRFEDDVVWKSKLSRRLVLPADEPCTMALVTAGPRKRGWGLWFEGGWSGSLEKGAAARDMRGQR